MRKKFFFYFFTHFILISFCAVTFSYTGLIHKAEPEKINNPPLPWLNVVLLPLDSRPPCTQFVEQLAHIANINIIIPPSKLMDNYKKPADRQALRQWLLENTKQADIAIISTDMLIHGGLVASRLSNGTIADAAQTLDLLTVIHAENPKIKLYVFNIIPRLLIADNDQNAKYQKNMLQYSVLKDEIIQFENPTDIQKLSQIEKKIPTELSRNYLNLYEQNNFLNFSLVKLVEQGIITHLVIGQDDSQPFGLPNINKQKLQQYIKNKSTLTDKIMITRGTDELALSILGHIISEAANYHPRVFITYSHTDAPNIIMPFMPMSVAQSVREKIALAGAVPVSTPNEADFILYIHIGTKSTQSGFQMQKAARQVNILLKDGYKVAMVDLAEDFYFSEALLPVLIENEVNVSQLIAYAGWNTTSNSLGTALTQAIAFTKMQHDMHAPHEMVRVYKENLEFSISRFIDDYYYQKKIQPEINKGLKAIHVDPYNLNTYHQQADRLVQNRIRESADQFFTQALANKVIIVNSVPEPQTFTITKLSTQNSFPWDRTFEIRLNANISLAHVK